MNPFIVGVDGSETARRAAMTAAEPRSVAVRRCTW